MPDPARLRAAERLLRVEEDAAYVARLSASGDPEPENGGARRA